MLDGEEEAPALWKKGGTAFYFTSPACASTFSFQHFGQFSNVVHHQNQNFRLKTSLNEFSLLW